MPEHLISLSPTNPGLVFACCGLFELAAAQDPAAMAHFSPDATVFHLATGAQLPPPLDLAPPRDSNPNPFIKDSIAEIEVLFGGSRLRLNWWLNAAQNDKSELKTWGGNQSSRSNFLKLLALLDDSLSVEELFSQVAYTTTRFGGDPRTAWDKLDVGFSPNELDRKATSTYPWVEVLYAIGLQGFRPCVQNGSAGRSIFYSLWIDPLPVTAARAALSSFWPGLRSRRFESLIGDRGQGYKTLLLAKEKI